MEGSTARVLDQIPRIIGDISGSRPGPTIICTGAIHGNEPTGVDGIVRVLSLLESVKEDLSGRFIGLVGNRTAFSQSKRYIDEDLNRIWTPQRVQEIFKEKSRKAASAEEIEMLELAEIIDPILDPSKKDIFYFDLHTTSGPTVPFSWLISDTRADELIYRLPMPVVEGLEPIAAAAQYIGDKGYPVLCAEGGQHFSKESIDHFEAMLILGLHLCGCLNREVIPKELEKSEALLEQHCGRLPKRINVFFTHSISEEDGFKMKPGYKNFQLVTEGEVLAEDKSGEILAPRDCRIMLPLYQKLGADGFFLAEDIA